MTRDPRYDPLFEPLRLGPVTTKNRFYQVPHCTGLGWLRPRMLAEMRGLKAEGGWGVVCTEYCSIHPASDDLPYPYASLWDDTDVRAQALMTEKVHAHGALAGVELWFGGARSGNLQTREVPMDVVSVPNLAGTPYQCRAMDKADIRALRRWHREAALRARQAGFDIVYVYATHGYLLSHFLSAETNSRGDEYGGSLENRVRLVRELIEETKEAVGDRCAVAVRFSAGGGDAYDEAGEHRDRLALLADLPDLWDINIDDYGQEMGVSRLIKEASLERHIAYVKTLTDVPVVSVGRFTSPDAMAAQLKRGVVDLIGAARPSIADPFLPKKIEAGNLDDIRECIGCNICYASDGLGVAIRCTQNPTMGEEWTRGWHPEQIALKASDSAVLVVGAGPAGLEAARALGQRGYHVMLAEASRELGGRVSREAKLPGLGEWIRVRHHRVQQLEKLPNVEIFRESEMGAEDVLAVGADHVAIATGATWRADGLGRSNMRPIDGLGPAERIFTPDDIMAGRLPDGPCVIYDDDHYYMACILAERLHEAGVPLTFVTSADRVATWARYTAEQWESQARLIERGIDIVTAHTLAGFDGETVDLACGYSENQRQLAAPNLLLVTARRPNDALYYALHEKIEADAEGAPKSLKRIGDCEAPAIIAAAVFAGHRYARELEADIDPARPMRYDRVFVEGA